MRHLAIIIVLASLCACAAPKQHSYWLERGHEIKMQQAQDDWARNQREERNK